MTIDYRPAHNAAKSDPLRNASFRARWFEPTVTGPDVPDSPAHDVAWQADAQPQPIAGSNYRNRAKQAAERAFAGDRGSRYRGTEQ